MTGRTWSGGRKAAALTMLRPRVTAIDTRVAASLRVSPESRARDRTERAKLYRTARWLRERRVFITANPVCATPGCGKPSVVADHVIGHQRTDWRLRFWNQAGWQALCLSCHAAKSAGELAEWAAAGGVLGKIPAEE